MVLNEASMNATEAKVARPPGSATGEDAFVFDVGPLPWGNAVERERRSDGDPWAAALAEVERRLKFAHRRINLGQALYREADRFQFIFAVRTGTFKSTVMLNDGREQVMGFEMAGELLGLDGLATGQHASSAVALEDAEVGLIPYDQLRELAATSTALQHLISRFLSREIVRVHSLMMILGSMNAEERLAAFLLNISRRMKARGYSATEFHLRMSRAEIGSCMGMKLETVSRTFTAFQQQGLLEVEKRHVRMLDVAGLERKFEADRVL
jgi:CRP/FNR family transcriptional regulator, anaerobic regulatory protein